VARHAKELPQAPRPSTIFARPRLQISLLSPSH
jgi:hypothetical protein